MNYLNRTQMRQKINELAGLKNGPPFLFLIDFKGEKGLVLQLDELAENGVYCAIDGVEIGQVVQRCLDVENFEIEMPKFEDYKRSFDLVYQHILHGDSYLLNLTWATPLHGKLDLRSIYSKARAKYKFMVEDCFLFYSPESFVKIENGKIYSFPMKGTIADDGQGAEKRLLESQKELFEHYTIVDLIRNDLSIVASEVEVEKFRYVEKINTARGQILQTSSCVSGSLREGWRENFGDLLFELLPAGSISGAPKQRTLEVIEEAEPVERGFYTGVMGVFRDGVVDSCVNIRYLECRDDGRFYYRSGGGITSRSEAEMEYEELKAKIYVPVV